MCEPYKKAWIMKQESEKEYANWVKNFMGPALAAGGAGSVEAEAATGYYRVPHPGESFVISGMRHRPELNGLRGTIVNSQQDAHGRITVRVFGDNERDMKIQPFRLVPSSTSANLQESDTCSSVRSFSRAGSQVSVGGRSLGSAISLSAKRALSNLSSNRRQALAKADSSPSL
eukprot:TRINITY_DN68042_c0_g1_i1.p1 TRINITY_DN68042_c0_g1~~TRINITY_DN68042_c0_g1_i1.p1  ORF type:complete len:173 (-),score=32.52 TRINITY_DN68042_c0_g1_i1:38-556(-)